MTISASDGKVLLLGYVKLKYTVLLPSGSKQKTKNNWQNFSHTFTVFTLVMVYVLVKAHPLISQPIHLMAYTIFHVLCFC